MIRSALAALTLAFALAHLPFLPSSLEDIDSVNFALATRDFDVAEHRPHPPGYPIYVAVTKAAVALAAPFSSRRSSAEARSMAALSLVSALIALALLYRLFACLTVTAENRIIPPWRTFDPLAVAATALTAACPLFWYMAVRPMSDMPGLAASLAAQVALGLAFWRQQPLADGDRRLNAESLRSSGQMIILGALLAGVATGFRSQVAVLTVPLLLAVLIDRIGRGVGAALMGAIVAMSIGIVTWAIPLMIASGGVNSYLAALGSQAGADFEGVEMLYLNPDNPRLAAMALLRTFIHPWESLALGGTIMALATAGVVALALRNRRALVFLMMMSAPYLIFHLLFQDTSFTRYALPLIPPVAFLVVTGLDAMARRAAVPLTGALALWAIALASPVLAAYGTDDSPTARAVAAIRTASASAGPVVLAMHQTFRRPLEAEDLHMRQLPSPPRREWLELVRYWKDGNKDPVWFLADPRRSDLALIDPASRREQTDFAWRYSSLTEVGGMRPAGVMWYRMPDPGWFAEEGWALTPETAGIARLMGRGPHLGPITAWVRRRAEATKMMIGGRNLGAPHDPAAMFTASVDGKPVADWKASPGFFLHVFTLPAGTLVGDGPRARLTISSSGVNGASVPTAIEQFDLQSSGAMMWGYGKGWQEAEYNPQLGVWRWTSDRSELEIIDAHTDVTLTLRVESALRYFDEPSTLRISAGGQVLDQRVVSEDAAWSVTIPLSALRDSAGVVMLESSQIFVPSERGRATDQRRLGLRIFAIAVR